MPKAVSLAQPETDPNDPVCGLALLDHQGRFEWVNEQLADMLGTAVDGMTGRCVEQLPPDRRAWFQDTHGLIPWTDAQGRAHQLRPERHAADGKTLLVLRDVSTEQELLSEVRRLRQQVEDLKLTDDLTGLPNRRAIGQALELQISRSRRYKNPLTVVLAHIALHNDQIERLRGNPDPLVLAISRLLRDRLRWVDQIGRWEDNIFLLVLPETEQEDARALLDKISTEIANTTLPPPLEGINPVLSFGMGVWKKGDDLRTLLRAASRDLAGD
jgi:diguanylate cyclase (GGDEF)-like protein